MKVDIKSNSKKQSEALSGNIDSLIDFTVSKVGAIADSITSGDTSISPIDDGDIKACEYCDYKSVCTACDRPKTVRKLQTPPKDWLKGE